MVFNFLYINGIRRQEKLFRNKKYQNEIEQKWPFTFSAKSKILCIEVIRKCEIFTEISILEIYLLIFLAFDSSSRNLLLKSMKDDNTSQ